jgi:hypothetical protein
MFLPVPPEWLKQPFVWGTASPYERAKMVRQHRYEGKLNLCDLFCLTDEGLAAILAGGDWKPEYERHERNGM